VQDKPRARKLRERFLSSEEASKLLDAIAGLSGNESSSSRQAPLSMGQRKSKRLFQAFHASDVDFFQKLKTEPWGARTLIVRNPDGNLVQFAAPAD